MSSEVAPDRLPPQNLKAEQSVLGSMLRDNLVINEVVQFVKADNFYSDAHQKIFQVIVDIYNNAQPVDLVILADRLKQLHWLEDVGSYPYLAELWDAAPTAANAEYYARIVREKSIVRSLIHTSTEILRDAYDQALPADEMLGGAERKILEIANKGAVGQTYELREALKDAFDRIDIRSRRDPLATSGLSTGFADLNEKTAGLQNSELVILAARPSVGKCLSADAEVLLADGSLATMVDLYRRRRARLLTLHRDRRFRPAEASAFVDDGHKPVYRVRTESGRCVEATLSHPFRVLQGWRPLAELRVGSIIAVPRRLAIFGTEALRDDEVEELAHRLATVGEAAIAGVGSRRGGARQLDPEREVPPTVFRLPAAQLALFLNRVFAADGWAEVGPDGPSVGLTADSERLARQYQHLLLRFGVVAGLRERSPDSPRWAGPGWELEVTEQQSLRAFLAEVGSLGGEGELAAVQDALAHARPEYPTRDDLYWEPIVSIEAVGVKQVYDLTVPETHNFVANDVCVHNTAFALNMIRHMIVEEGEPVFFVSLEQARVELAERLLCSQAQVDSHRLRKGHLSADDIQKLIEAGDQLRNAKLFIDDTPMQGMLRIAANARRLKNSHNIKLVAIDYLQLIEAENRRDARQEQVAQISRRLKFLARELNIPVLALAQVNRSSEDRQDHRPRLSDLRESGSIEQDADTVFLLHRQERTDPSQLNDTIEVIIAKQRNGPTGEVTLTYSRQYMRYENYAPDGFSDFSR